VCQFATLPFFSEAIQAQEICFPVSQHTKAFAPRGYEVFALSNHIITVIKLCFKQDRQTYVCKLQPSLLHSIRITNSNSAFHLIQSTNSCLARCCCRVSRAGHDEMFTLRLPSFPVLTHTININTVLHHPVAVYDQSLDLTKIKLQVKILPF
jgi:hypothetical protein